MDAEPWVPRERSLRALRAAAQKCRGCDLWSGATQAVLGEGPRASRLMLIGEQPGDAEDRAGAPFVGPAGRLLDAVLEEAGIARDEVYVTNTVKHFRHEGTRGKQRIHKSPAQRHVTACRPWLDAELDLIRPDGVLALGATAAHALLGKDFKLTAQRGRLLEWPGHTQWALATVHPSAVLRSRLREEDRARMVTDLVVAARALTG